MYVITHFTRTCRPPYGCVDGVARATTPRRMLLLALLVLLAGAQIVVASTYAPLFGELEEFPCGP